MVLCQNNCANGKFIVLCMKQYSFERIPQPPAVVPGRTKKGLEQDFTQFHGEGNQLANVKRLVQEDSKVKNSSSILLSVQLPQT